MIPEGGSFDPHDPPWIRPCIVSSYTYLTCAHTIVDMVMVLCADRCIILGLN